MKERKSRGTQSLSQPRTFAAFSPEKPPSVSSLMLKPDDGATCSLCRCIFSRAGDVIVVTTGLNWAKLLLHPALLNQDGVVPNLWEWSCFCAVLCALIPKSQLWPTTIGCQMLGSESGTLHATTRKALFLPHTPPPRNYVIAVTTLLLLWPESKLGTTIPKAMLPLCLVTWIWATSVPCCPWAHAAPKSPPGPKLLQQAQRPGPWFLGQFTHACTAHTLQSTPQQL